MGLVTVHNNQLVTSSRMVAEKFGKQHKHVIEAIRNISTQISTAEFSALFYESEYIASNGKANKEYLMNRDGFSLLVMGFTGKEALQFKLEYIDAFNKMEQKLKELALPQDSYMIADPVERAKRWIEEAMERKALQEENAKLEGEVVGLNNTIDQLKPKADYTDKILSSSSTIYTTEIAVDYGMKAKKFNQLLHQLGVQYRLNNGRWVLYQKHQGRDYARSVTECAETDNGGAYTYTLLKWTQKGRLFLYNLLKAHGVMPEVELAND